MDNSKSIKIEMDNNTTNFNVNDGMNMNIDSSINFVRDESDRTRKINGDAKPKLTVPMDGMDLLTNPKKKMVASSDEDNESIIRDDASESDVSPHSMNSNNPINPVYTSPHNKSFTRNIRDDESNSSFVLTDHDNDNNKHSDLESIVSDVKMSYEEIQQKKSEYLFKLDRLARAGYRSARKLSMASNLDDIRHEVDKLSRERNVAKSIKFSRKALMAIVSGFEFINTKFDPIGLKLDGWSESQMEGIEDYDEVFEELYDKYNTKVQLAPELRLLMMVGGSAFMFHLTNTLFKSSMPGLNDILKQNPDIMRNIQQAALNNMNEKSGNDPVMNMMMNGVNMKNQSNTRRQEQQQYQPQQQRRPVREMKGPRDGVEDLLASLNGGNNNNNMPDSQRFEVASTGSESDAQDNNLRNIDLSKKVRRRRRKRNTRNAIDIDM